MNKNKDIFIDDVITILERDCITDEDISNCIEMLTEIKQRSIIWSVADFKQEADTSEYPSIYDPEKFEDGLHEMIANHDASFGITWDDVRIALNNFCIINPNSYSDKSTDERTITNE